MPNVHLVAPPTPALLAHHTNSQLWGDSNPSPPLQLLHDVLWRGVWEVRTDASQPMDADLHVQQQQQGRQQCQQLSATWAALVASARADLQGSAARCVARPLCGPGLRYAGYGWRGDGGWGVTLAVPVGRHISGACGASH